jgi:DNA polymerase elongation subunit (family B)
LRVASRFGYKDGIKDIVDLGDNFLLQYNDTKEEFNTLLDNGRETHNINIAIAAAVTAYARIYMSQFKNNNLLPRLYYSDTDSLYFDGPLPDSFISQTDLGKLKLEGIYDSAVFLAPKVYALKNNQEEIIKIKGLSKESIINNNITLGYLEQLLIKDSPSCGAIQISQNKWFRHLDQGTINILEQIYTLKATGNKRELVACDNESERKRLIGTTPFFLINGELNTNKL